MATPSPTRANTAGPKPPHAAGSDGASQQTTTASTSVSASLPSSTPSTATSTPASTLVGALKPLASKIARKESPSSATSNPTALPPPATTKDNAEGGAGVSLGLSTTQLGASSAPSPSVATPTNAGVDPLSQVRFVPTQSCCNMCAKQASLGFLAYFYPYQHRHVIRKAAPTAQLDYRIARVLCAYTRACCSPKHRSCVQDSDQLY